MLIEILYGSLAVVVVLLAVIVFGLRSLSSRLAARARRERPQAQAEGVRALQGAAAAAVGPVTASLKQLEEQMETRHRDELAAVELRARVAQRRAAETVPLLTAATETVREMRAAVDGLAAVVGRLGGSQPSASGAPPPG